MKALKIFLSLLTWVVLDVFIGKQQHKKHHRTLVFDETKGDYRFYKNGSPLFEDMFEEITQAQYQIDVYFYQVRRDKFSRKFLDLLKMKAEEGIQVHLLVDQMVSAPVRFEMDALEEAGVHIGFAETPSFPSFFYTLNRRNHRKMVVIDGVIGYVGGFNVGREYIGNSSEFMDWRDYHLRLTGSIVRDLHRIIVDDWSYNTGDVIPSVSYREGGSYPFQIVAFDGIGVENTFLTMIRKAKQEILIGSPYFIPTRKIHRALLDALDRGVAVHVLVPRKRDHALVKEAGFPFKKELVDNGAYIHYYNAGFYHAKLVMVDKEATDIGTANFDRRSMFLNKEVTISIFDPAFVQHLREEYFKDIENSLPFEEVDAHLTFGEKLRIQISKPFRGIL
ncbi:phospholipase D-like domain-containing protein [Salimicrobium halophilum]|uniref:Cardiolipin synthase n=1 Tax=Salimicrobium halophilum TaxID=86666 RepID=A0A1G8WAB1_9BACI|nr:phospholipase D-like domain-containing protein [Salimicrobium halophilum]SDJ75133.1 cardiolipin synthase [Salimicrobium halophilum]